MIEVMAWNGGLEVLKAVFDAWEAENNGEDFGIAVSRLSVRADIQSLMDSPDADLLVLNDEGAITGFLGIFKVRNFLNDQFVAIEKYWYVLPESRKHGFNSGYLLKRKAEEWAKQHKCTHLIMSASNLASDKHDKVCRLYEHWGMRLFETSYIIEV